MLSEFNHRGITDLDCWYDVGSHFRNRSMLHFHFCDVPKIPFNDLNCIGYHNHTGKHGKTIVDGHFVFVSDAVSEANGTEHGVQCSEDIVCAIETADECRLNGSDEIEYYPINFDWNGPLQDSPYMQPLLAQNLKEKVLLVPQLKAHGHYIFRRANQVCSESIM